MLSQKQINDICDHAAASDLAKVNWSGRERAPIGYIKGMAVTYGLCLQKLADRDSAALAMVRVVDGEHDVFDYYADKLHAINIVTAGASDVDRLRALFVVVTGLAGRESSFGSDIGRDQSASNVTADTAEAGAWQQSWGSRRASPEIEKLFRSYQPGPVDEIFKEGVKLRPGALENFGDGDGRDFQALAKRCPAFAAQCAAIGLRTLYNEWGPIIRQEAEVRPEADALFRQVQGVVGVKASGTAGKPAAPSTGWLSMLAAAVMAMFRGASTKPPTVPVPAATDLAGRIVAAMRKRGLRIDTVPGQVNTVYVEGMGPEGDKNDNRPNEFNDARFVIGFDGARPRILGAWEATTEPGNYWTEHRMNPGGAFHIALEQQTAWVVGVHHSGSPSAHEALVQHGVIRGFRDPDETGKRDTRHPYAGEDMGINQHWGYDLAKGDLGTSSAGCLVGRMKSGHRQFMTLVKSDPRYIANNRFVFTAAVLPASEV